MFKRSVPYSVPRNKAPVPRLQGTLQGMLKCVRPAGCPAGLEPLLGALARIVQRLHGGLDFMLPPNRPAGLVAAEPQGLWQKFRFDPPTDLSSRDAELCRHLRIAEPSFSHCNRS